MPTLTPNIEAKKTTMIKLIHLSKNISFFWFPKVSLRFYPMTDPSRHCWVPRRGPLPRKFAASTRAQNQDHLLKRPEPPYSGQPSLVKQEYLTCTLLCGLNRCISLSKKHKTSYISIHFIIRQTERSIYLCNKQK